MSYTKTEWISGETPLSADNLNNIEDGIYSAHSGVDTLNDKGILIDEQVFWNNLKIILYHVGPIVTAQFMGEEGSTASPGAKNAYITIPEGYRPAMKLHWTVSDQHGKRAILQADPSGNIGIYYLLDAITSPTFLTWAVTWAAYQ